MRRIITATALCVTAVLLVGIGSAEAARSNEPLSSEGVLQQETSLGDLVADALKEAGSAQAALVNAAQFKAGTIPAGKVTPGDVSARLNNPTGKWVVSSLTGKCLKAALERALSRASREPQPSAHFLQVAGLRVTYDRDAAAGARVTSLKIGGAPVQDNTTYRVAMPEDLAKGGSGYFTISCFNEGTIQPGATGTLVEAITALLDANATLNYSQLDRIEAAK
jgi:2',3'-cyclic-nucleotide 2'-phosphodiesterase (5'-nucleotidase family)